MGKRPYNSCTGGRSVIKASDFKNHRIFMLKYIGHNLVPVSIRLKPLKSKQFISTSARKIIEKAERQLMQDRVRTINNTIEVNESNGNHNKTSLASIVTQVDLDRCINFIEKVRQDRFIKVKDRQVRKYELLSNRNRSIQDSNHNFNNNRLTQRCNEASIDNSYQLVSDRDINKWVINLSKTELTTAQKTVLANGPNYAISPSNIPSIEYITAIETIGQKLKEEEVPELKADINTILRKGQVPKSNLNKEERRALSQLRKDQDRVILTADKGVAMVVLDKEDYISKAQELLAQLAYKEIPRDPTNKIKAQLIS